MGACKRRLFGTHKPGLPLRQPPIAGSFSIDGVRLLPLMLANSFRLHPRRRLDSDISTRPREAAQRFNDPVAGGFFLRPFISTVELKTTSSHERRRPTRFLRGPA